MASQAEDFAGMFMSATDEITILMKSDLNKGAAEARIRQIFARSGRHTKGQLRVKFALARYSYEELDSWMDLIFNALSGESEFAGISILEKTNRILVDAAPGSDVSAIVARVRSFGVPVDAFDVAEAPPLNANSDTTLTQRLRPIRGGLIMGPIACTLGPIADWGGQKVILIASHCSEYKWNPDVSSNWIMQPDTASVGWGTEAFDYSGRLCDDFWWDRCRRSDVAAYPTSGIDLRSGESQAYAFGELVRPANRVYGPSNTYGSSSIDVAHPLIITGVAEDVIVGDTVDKIGWKTGWTYGAVVNACHKRLAYETNGHGRYVECMVDADYNSKSGDSGGPVFVFNGDSTVSILGVNFGNYNPDGDAYNEHTGVFSKMSMIRMDMSDHLLTFYPAQLGGGGPTYSASISGPNPVLPDATCVWSASTNISDPSEWRVDGQPLGSDVDFSYSASSSFTLDLVVWNISAGAWAPASAQITVTSEAGTCYAQ